MISSGPSGVTVTRSEYGSAASNRFDKASWASRSLSAIACLGVESRAIASRLIGFTSAARLMLTWIRWASSSTTSLNQVGLSSCICARQSGSRAIQHVVHPHRLAEIHGDLAVVRAQHFEHAADQRPHRFLLLGLAGEFVEVALALDQFFVADIDRLEHHRPPRRAQEGAHGHRDHAALGRHQPPGARTAALDEILQRESFADQLGDVFGKHGGVQRVAADAAAQEERAAPAQHRADDRQVEVVAGGDMRRHDAVLVQQVAEQQVIHVAAMAGHVDDFMPWRDLLELVQVVHGDAVVDPVPETGQAERKRAHHRVGIIGGDFPGEAVRLLPGLQVFAAVAPGLVGDRLAHRFGIEHAIDQQAPGRQVRADDRGADLAEVGAQYP